MKKNNENSEYIGKFLKKDYNQFKDGLLELLDDYKRKSERLDKIIKQSDKMQLRLIEANEELDEYKNNLEIKVKEEIRKREEKEKIILEQSKFAAMGEMIDAIAHQWIQPLNILSLKLNSLSFAYENGKVDSDYIKNFETSNREIIEEMNNTLIEFRTFFRPNKPSSEFAIDKMIKKVLLFVKDEFIKHKIEINFDIIDSFKLLGIENEFKHIILNLINNSKDAFCSNNIPKRVITIKVYKEEHYNVVEVSDNAGGVPDKIINDIFKANVTTKRENGTGIGLYLSTQIAQKNNALLDVKNIQDGACFTLRIPK
ncbi:histidine kinase [Halarcobacter ebronensis]|uniref:histidine kinase n=1 Tax=Halarcobacter ebronensis TaxID=1462615 RepID=A0A4Q0Y524_9BACT|nr:HAMP domain-containing sensor histidine kinase [Halarcobacter ebronensis]RXJ65267.1 histidine kinase [Halarcobacter ebronensis]